MRFPQEIYDKRNGRRPEMYKQNCICFLPNLEETANGSSPGAEVTPWAHRPARCRQLFTFIFPLSTLSGITGYCFTIWPSETTHLDFFLLSLAVWIHQLFSCLSLCVSSPALSPPCWLCHFCDKRILACWCEEHEPGVCPHWASLCRRRSQELDWAVHSHHRSGMRQ